MKKFFVGICALFLLFVSCGKNEDTPQPKPVPSSELTILAYLVANNNLDSDLLSNIGAMYDGLAKRNQQATLLVY